MVSERLDIVIIIEASFDRNEQRFAALHAERLCLLQDRIIPAIAWQIINANLYAAPLVIM